MASGYFAPASLVAASATEEMLRQIREDRDLVNLGEDE
jgi:hypothetical protein